MFFLYRFINDVEDDDNDISDENDYNTLSRKSCVYIVRAYRHSASEKLHSRQSTFYPPKKKYSQHYTVTIVP